MSWFSSSCTVYNRDRAERTQRSRTKSRKRCALSVELLESRLTPAIVPATAIGQYVRSLYQDLLGRAASQPEIAAWSAVAASSPSEVIVADILSAPEYHNAFVTKAYQQFLGRLPDVPGLNFWSTAMSAGKLEEQIQANFASSPEYMLKNGADSAGYVEALYTSVLGRAPDPAGVGYWLGKLASGTSAIEVATSFIVGAEGATTEITRAYENYLHREPDPAGLAFWLHADQAGGNVFVVREGILSSQEFIDGLDTNPVINQATPPVITSVTSPTGALISGGLLEITGSGFLKASSLSFSAGKLEWTSMRSDPSDTVIRASYFPVAHAGPAELTLTSPGGSTSISITLSGETFAPAPPQTDLATSAYMPQPLFAYQGWDGNIWWVSNSIPNSNILKIGDIWNSTLSGDVTEFNLPGTQTGHSVNQLTLSAGADGAMFSLSGKTSSILYRIALPAVPGQGITSIDLSSITNAGYLPQDVHVGPDGNLWVTFADTSHGHGSVLVKLSPDLQTMTQISIPSYVILSTFPDKNGNLYAVASTVPFASNATSLLEINTRGVVVNATVIPNATNLQSFVYGSDGFLYFINGPGVLRVDPSNLSETTQIPVPFQVALGQITPGTDGNVWVTVDNQNFIAPGADSGFAVITPTGSVTESLIPGSSKNGTGQTFGITPGSDGNMYLPGYVNQEVGAVGYLVQLAHS